MKLSCIFGALLFVCLPLQAAYTPTEIITFGSSVTNVISANDPIPNNGNPTWPRETAFHIEVTGTNYARPGIGTPANQVDLLKNDYLVNGAAITSGTVHVLTTMNGPFDQVKIDGYVEMVQALTDAGAQHIYLEPIPFGGRIPYVYFLAQAEPDPDTYFADSIVTVDAQQNAFADQVMAAVWAINPSVIRMDWIKFMEEFSSDSTPWGIAPEDFYFCFKNGGIGPTQCEEHPVFGENGSAPDASKLAFSDGVHMSYTGYTALGQYIAWIIEDDARNQSGSGSAAEVVPTMSVYGLILTMLGLLVLVGRRLLASAKRR